MVQSFTPKTRIELDPVGLFYATVTSRRHPATFSISAYLSEPVVPRVLQQAVNDLMRLRALSTPYHLAHGLLDRARHLIRGGDNAAAAAVIGEARDIATQLRCRPLLHRIAAVTPAEPRVGA